jgi:hypothetical protein
VCEADTIDIADIAQNDNNITQNDSDLSQNDIENEVSRRKISDNNYEELVSYDISMEDGPVTFEEVSYRFLEGKFLVTKFDFGGRF